MIRTPHLNPNGTTPKELLKCHSACNIGSDSLLMQFGRCLAL
jgi:hypothetical protein